MKDELTNKITGSVTTATGFPLVVKVKYLLFQSIYHS
jgi:hypothetical protein